MKKVVFILSTLLLISNVYSMSLLERVKSIKQKIWIEGNNVSLSSNKEEVEIKHNWDQIPTAIILHHSATPQSNDYDKELSAVNKSHAKRVHWLQPSNQLRDDYPDISYHYIIFPDWHIEQTRRETRVWWATQENNDWYIQILLLGDFRYYPPTEEQYKSLNEKIADIQTRWNIWSIRWHWQEEWESTACPWPLFDYLRVDQIKKRTPDKPKIEWDLLGHFRITSYYSPTLDQDRTFFSHKLGRRRTMKEEVEMQCWWNDSLSLEENIQWCKHPANWMEYLPEHAGSHVACPKELPKETKLTIEWYWDVTCVDRWWSIVWKQIDMWQWYWTTGLNNIEKWLLWVPQYANIYIK